MPTDEQAVPKACCTRCYYATQERCTCKCGGAYHGQGRTRIVTVDTGDPTLPFQEEQLVNAAIPNEKDVCSDCELRLRSEIYYFPHSAGWIVQGINNNEPVWLYKICPKCHYQWAISKLGVAREEAF